MQINVPELSLVLLIGASGSGKSTFAAQHFGRYEVVSSDQCRGLVANDESNQVATNDAFELLHFLVGKRLERGLLTVVDATNVQSVGRKKLIALAREYHALTVAIVFDLPVRVLEDRLKTRKDRDFGTHVIVNQNKDLRRSLRGLKREGFTRIFKLVGEEEINAVTGIVRDKLYNDKKHISEPFDVIGDVHGCRVELEKLLEKLDYEIREVEEQNGNFGLEVSHPQGRKVVFVGDLVDRGPDSVGVLKLAMSMANSGIAYCVAGNHDIKLLRKIRGKKVQLKHGLAETIAQLEQEPPEFHEQVREFLFSLISHYIFDEGKLAIAHAGIPENMQGRGSGAVRGFCLYGDTTGEIDEFGLPVRLNWAQEYRGKAIVVHGHVPVPEAEWLNRTIDIDTGCCFGGKLTALRYPELELVDVPAEKVYSEPIRPLLSDSEVQLSAQHVDDGMLHIEDVSGKRIIQTHLRPNLTIREENSIAALEVMSRFAINPKWLVYLPPTMSPCATSEKEGFLEHPEQALNYYKKRGVKRVVCEEKHMGSRAVVVLGRDEEVVKDRFGIVGEGLGKCYTRTGRNFFVDAQLESAFMLRVRDALTNSGFWERMKSDWVVMDCELMPWSAKAQALVSGQYASVGAAARNALPEVTAALQAFIGRGGEDAAALLDKYQYKRSAIDRYTKAYQNYCWEVNSLNDYKLAPFHILATEGQVHHDKHHEWHMEEIRRICAADEQLFLATPYRIVELQDEASYQAAVDWWLEMVERGGEGMVVKPYDFITHSNKGLLQPAVKCRGSEYLRIIYGPEYDRPENIQRLRNRKLNKKRSLALREFALGIESLERFVNKEPLRRIHESVFAVLALESEEVDPRL